MPSNATDPKDIEEYLIEKASKCISRNELSCAKSWLLTASCMYPKSFKIQHEAYKLARSELNVKDASKCLEDLLSTTLSSKSSESLDSDLMREVQLIVETVKTESITDSTSSSSTPSVANSTSTAASPTGPHQPSSESLSGDMRRFYRQLFSNLPPNLKYELMTKALEFCTDQVESCKMMVLVLRLFPEKIHIHGPKLIDILASEKQSNAKSSNFSSPYFRRLLVGEVLPLIFGANSSFQVPDHQVHRLVIKTLKFFVEETVGRNNGNTCPTEGHLSVENVKEKVNNVLNLIGMKKNWELLIDQGKMLTFEERFDKIANFASTKLYSYGNSSGPIDLSNPKASVSFDENSLKHVVYAAIRLYIECLIKYNELSRNEVLVECHVQGSPPTAHAIHTEVIVTTKKRKIMNEPVLLSSNQNLNTSLYIAAKCMDLLNSDFNFNKELMHTLSASGLDTTPVHKRLTIDATIYHGNHREALALLRKEPEPKSLKTIVQIICCHLFLHDYNPMFEACMEAVQRVKDLPSVHDKTSPSSQPSRSALNAQSGATRCLQFVSQTIEDVLRFVIDSLVSWLSDRVILSLSPSDLAIGHLIVLTQFDWPRHMETFQKCANLIRKIKPQAKTPQNLSANTKFTYHQYCVFVHNPDIIEEFMSLVHDGYTLDFGPMCGLIAGTSRPIGKPVITTRGVNKEVKEEIKTTLIVQMQNSKYKISHDTFINFILTEIKDLPFSK